MKENRKFPHISGLCPNLSFKLYIFKWISFKYFRKRQNLRAFERFRYELVRILKLILITKSFMLDEIIAPPRCKFLADKVWAASDFGWHLCRSAGNVVCVKEDPSWEKKSKKTYFTPWKSANQFVFVNWIPFGGDVIQKCLEIFRESHFLCLLLES